MSHLTRSEQLSLIPAFGVMNHPESDRYNSARDQWELKFGAYMTLSRYTPNMTSTSQSSEQKAALMDALSNPATLDALRAIDVGDAVLNAKIRRHICGSVMALQDQQAQAERVKNSHQKNLRDAEAQAKKQADEHAQLARLAQLDLQEKLLAYEEEFSSKELAEKSRYVKQAKSVPGITPVFTENKIWNSRHPIGADGRPLYNPMENPHTAQPDGWFKTTWILTFEQGSLQ